MCACLEARRRKSDVDDSCTRFASLEAGDVLDSLEAEEGEHADHGGAAVEELLLPGPHAGVLRLGVGEEGHDGGGGEESDGEENLRGGLSKLLVDGLAGGDLGAGGGDETEHGEAAVHDLRTGAREVGALGAGEGEGLREGEGGGNRGGGRDLGGGLGRGLLGGPDRGRAARGARRERAPPRRRVSSSPHATPCFSLAYPPRSRSTCRTARRCSPRSTTAPSARSGSWRTSPRPSPGPKPGFS
mmetsp:Transcript_1242/g.5368  ORF Transcript_1242/g.5368 Transcript_1242/m.5368 type:complete len:243 (+) Transcript_1242:515-1243(+)